MKKTLDLRKLRALAPARLAHVKGGSVVPCIGITSVVPCVAAIVPCANIVPCVGRITRP